MQNYFTFTKHATLRCQQRGIPKEVVEFIANHGDSFRTHEARKYFLNKKKLRKLMHSNKAFFVKFDKYLMNTTVVCDDSKKIIVTAMKANKGSIKWN